MDFCTCLLNLHSLSSMKDDVYIYNNVITCIFWRKIFNASALVEYTFSDIATRLSSSTEPSQQVC